MKIELKEITVRELTDGYEDNDEDGVLGYSGKLDIRPPFQREFIYKDKQRDAVIDTITKEFPLNVMYWLCVRMAITRSSTGSSARFPFASTSTATSPSTACTSAIFRTISGSRFSITSA